MSTHDKLTHGRLALVAQGVVSVVSERPFVIKIANWVKEPMTLPMRMLVAQCSVLAIEKVGSLEAPIDTVHLYKD